MPHAKPVSSQSLRQSIEKKLQTYTRQATNYRSSRPEGSFSRNFKRGTLAAIVPLAASAGDASAQCVTSAPNGPVILNAALGFTTTVGFGTNYTDELRVIFDVGTGLPPQLLVRQRYDTASAYVGLAPLVTADPVLVQAVRFDASVGFLGGNPRESARLCIRLGTVPPDTAFSYVGHFCPGDGPGILALRRSDGSMGWLQLGVGALSETQAIINIGPRRGDYPIGVQAHGGNCDAILPVELVSFTATSDDRSVRLAWETASELNNAGFEVQRSTQDGTFQKLTFVEGRGTATEANTYRHIDETIEANVRYRYRLKQIDFDGTTSFSEIVEVFTEDPSQIALSEFYPNPAVNGRATLKINVADPIDAIVEVYDVRGALVDARSQILNAGQNQLSFRTDDLAAGSHFAKVQIGERVLYRQFVVAR